MPIRRDADIDAPVHEGDKAELFRIADDALIADVVEGDLLIGGVELEALEPEFLNETELFLIVGRIGVHAAEGKDVRFVGLFVDFAAARLIFSVFKGFVTTGCTTARETPAF